MKSNKSVHELSNFDIILISKKQGEIITGKDIDLKINEYDANDLGITSFTWYMDANSSKMNAIIDSKLAKIPFNKLKEKENSKKTIDISLKTIRIKSNGIPEDTHIYIMNDENETELKNVISLSLFIQADKIVTCKLEIC